MPKPPVTASEYLAEHFQDTPEDTAAIEAELKSMKPCGWMTPEERSWFKKLQKLAQQQPTSLHIQTTGGGGAVVCSSKDWRDNGAICHQRYEQIDFYSIDGGDPDYFDD